MAGKRTANLALTIALSTLLLASVVALSGLQSAIASSAAESTSDSTAGNSGNVVINYIYEIELENKDNPKLRLNETTVLQGESFSANGTNFDANSTADISIFGEQLFSLNKDGQVAAGSVALLLTRSNLTVTPGEGDALAIENAEGDEQGTGRIILATKVSPADFSLGEYDVALECEQVPNGESRRTIVSDPLVIDNASSRQFFEFSLAAGEYEQCKLSFTPAADEGEQTDSFESSVIDFEVVGDTLETSAASITNTTDSDGSFMQNITVSDDAAVGSYVLLSETRDGDAGEPEKRAIAPVAIAGSNTTISTESASGDGDDNDSDRDSRSNGSSSLPDVGAGNNTGNGTTPAQPVDNGTSQGTTPPPDTSEGDGGYHDPCQDVVTDTGNVNNTIVQSTSQSASNTVTDDDVINVVQKIHGKYDGNGNLTTSVSVDDSDSVSQTVRQHVSQQASIKNCYGESGETGNQTNSLDMNATQLASNAYSDNTTIIIIQTIIYPKDCDTNVDAPLSISDRDTVGQSIDQGIGQSGSISYGGSGAGSNTVVQSSMQVSSNNATNDEVITINQVIIVPPDCPVEIYAPVVVESNDNVHMSVAQTSEQSAAIDSGAGGVTILSSVEGSDQVTNTVVATASQQGQNTFTDNDTITIQQNVYYVNDTSGWTEDNYEKYLEEEFGNETATNDVDGNSTDTSSNSTKPNKKWKTGNGNSTATGEPARGGNSTGVDGESKEADTGKKKAGQLSNATDRGSSAGNSSIAQDEGFSANGTNTSGEGGADDSGNSTSSDDIVSGGPVDPPLTSEDIVSNEADASSESGASDAAQTEEEPELSEPVGPAYEEIPQAPVNQMQDEPTSTEPVEASGSEETRVEHDTVSAEPTAVNEPIVSEEPVADNSTSGT
jgi:hypothetical protein